MMNKIDGFFVMFSVYLIWVFAVFLVPLKIMIFFYVTIAAWSVGLFIGRLPRRLSKETERNYLNEMFELSANQNKTIAEMLQSLHIAAADNQSLVAIIDVLMFKYCPEEMTPEQIANYEAHQKVVNEPLH